MKKMILFSALAATLLSGCVFQQPLPAPEGLEIPSYSENQNILSYQGHTVSYNTSALIPDWVAYELTDEDSFFFFNPFSEVILQRVIDQIVWSWYENPRKMQLFFYYPTDEDVALLTGTAELMFTDEIDCSDLFDGDQKRERILVFETG